MANIKVTPQKFKAIKILLNSGATYAEICESFSISDYVVRNVKSSETIEEYRQKVAAGSSAYRKKLAAEMKAKQEEEERKAEKARAEEEQRTNASVPEKQVVEHRQTIQLQATHYLTEELREIKELLKGMSNKLAFIVEELTK